MCFVEVKSHAAFGPAGPIGARQRDRVARAAQGFLARRRDLDGCDVAQQDPKQIGRAHV